ncbi:hypothetical protein Trydic_g9347 [Trypoxylus dichotomus]
MSRRSATTTKVFVGSLPANATTEDLRRLFSPYGAIAECDIANRCGFLHLEDKDLAEKAIEELNNSTFMGVRISVEKGRVKPPNRTRGRGGGGGGPMRGGKDRAGPYSRDGFGPRFGAREYPPYPDRYDYERGGRFDEYPDRRPASYEDRRGGGYMGERGRPYSNGYERRPPYDDRPPYPEGPARTGYDERRMPPAGGFDERRPPLTDRRPLMDPAMNQGPRGPPANYDRSAGATDMFSRRDNAAKPMERSSGYSPTGGYGSSAPSYGQSGSTTSGYGGYGDSRGTGSMGYDSRTPAQSGGYGDSRGPSSYPDSRGPPPLGSNGGGSAVYSDSRAVGTGNTAYGASSGAGAYGSTGSAGYEGYGSSRSGTYDTAYPPLPQQRGYASGGGPAPRRDMPPGPGRRY